jgi:hypothetical protein
MRSHEFWFFIEHNLVHPSRANCSSHVRSKIQLRSLSMANEANQGQRSGGQQQTKSPSGQQQPGQKKPNPFGEQESQGNEQQRRDPGQEQGTDPTQRRTPGEGQKDEGQNERKRA